MCARLRSDIFTTGDFEGDSMQDGSPDVSRRGFLRYAAGGTAGSAAVGTAAAQEDGGGEGGGSGGGQPPDLGGWLDDTSNYSGSVENMRGEESVTVEVGAQGNGGPNAFAPPAIHVDVGTTVQFEWTGDGLHNVVEENEEYSSGTPVQAAGVNFEHTFEESGISNYYCDPHESAGMKGSVVIGDDYPTVQPAAPSGPQVPNVAKSLGVAATVVMLATLGMAYVFIKFGGDYGDFEA